MLFQLASLGFCCPPSLFARPPSPTSYRFRRANHRPIRIMHPLALLTVTLAGWALAQSETTEGPNLASWSRHMSMFPAETYCPETASNPYES